MIVSLWHLNAQCVDIDDWIKIIPSKFLPDAVTTLNSNNNLDIIAYKENYYVGFRTAPNHFASKKAKMYILSTKDFENWSLEKEIFLESDVREPRFYAKNDSLFFMFFKGGTKKFKFQPQGIYECYLHENAWSEITETNIPLGYVPWRVIEHDGTHYLSTYNGVNEYKLNVPAEFRIFERNAFGNWKPISEKPQIEHPRAIAEIEFTFDEKDDIWGVARLEFDGSYLVHARSSDYTKFEYWYSPHKFDSPLIFKHNGSIYLIARRNLNGAFVQKEGKYKSNLLKYSLTKKTTALYVLDTENKAIIHVMDFESTGDCAFPSIAPINENEFYILNYSSDIEKKEKSWIKGQLGKTFIYKTKMSIEDCGKYINQSTGRAVYRFE